jgi:predicted ABC-class ATPase
MTEGSMTGRPYGGADERTEEGVPGERPEKGQVDADPQQSPRAAQGGMSDDVTRVPGGGTDDPDGKTPGTPDATGPQG